MSKGVHIIPTGKGGKQLGKEQKRFNTLVEKIGFLRAQIELARQLDIELRRIGTERIRPAELKVMTATREWIFALHNHPEKDRLSYKLAQKFPEVILHEMEPLLGTSEYEDDRELSELFAYYEGSGRSYAEIAEEEADKRKKMKAQMMREMFGFDLDPEDLDEPAAAFEQMEDQQATSDAGEHESAGHQTKRPKTEARQAAEEKRKDAERAVKKTARQVYLDLVRHFHPDKEPDEVKRVEKTEVMKEITSAFEADDHLKLIELQMNLLANRENIVTGFDDAQLKFFNKTLQQQVNELELELEAESPTGNGNPYGALFSPVKSSMLRNIEQYIHEQKMYERSILNNLKIIRMPKVFQEFVRDYDEDSLNFLNVY
jgi:hypothetical protein